MATSLGNVVSTHPINETRRQRQFLTQFGVTAAGVFQTVLFVLRDQMTLALLLAPFVVLMMVWSVWLSWRWSRVQEVTIHEGGLRWGGQSARWDEIEGLVPVRPFAQAQGGPSAVVTVRGQRVLRVDSNLVKHRAILKAIAQPLLNNALPAFHRRVGRGETIIAGKLCLSLDYLTIGDSHIEREAVRRVTIEGNRCRIETTAGRQYRFLISDGPSMMIANYVRMAWSPKADAPTP